MALYGCIAMCKFIIFRSACYISMADNIVLKRKTRKCFPISISKKMFGNFCNLLIEGIVYPKFSLSLVHVFTCLLF